MVYRSALDDLIRHRPHDLRRDSKSRAPANEPELVMMPLLIPMSSPCALTSGPPELPRIDRCVRLDQATRCTTVT